MGKRKSSSENPNEDICNILLDLAEYEKNISKNVHKHKAYKKAAAALATHPNRVKNGQEARKLEGIGEKIAKKIDEILETGNLEKLSKIKADDSVIAINELTRVSGIGPSAAQKLVKSGIKSIEDLKANQELLNHHQKIGLKYLEEFEKKIPREEIVEIEKMLQKQCKELELCLTICGSYRREMMQSGDIDMLLTHEKYTSSSKKKPNYLKVIVDQLEKLGFISDSLSHGETKFMGVCSLKNLNKGDDKEYLNRRIDIRLIPYDQYYCGVLYFTGSDVFNQRMRAHAQEKGFTLNEYTLRKLGCTGVPGEELLVSCEEDIFDYINFPYKPPKERNN